MATDRDLSWDEILKPAWELLELDRRELITVLIYVMVLGIVSASVPFASQILVNQTAFTGTALPIIVLAMVVLGVMLIGAFVNLLKLRLITLIKKRTFVRTGLIAAKSLLGSTPSNTETDDREIANRFFDILTFQDRMALLISETLGVLVLTVFGVLLLAFYHPFLLAFSLVVVVGSISIIVPLARRGIDNGYEKSSDKYAFAYWLSQVAENRGLLRQGSEQHTVWKLTDNFLAKYVLSYFKYLNLLLLQGGALFVLQAIATSAFLGLGGWLVVEGRLNLGQMVAAEIILLSVLNSLGKFDKYLDSFYDFVVSAKKVHYLTHAGEIVDQNYMPADHSPLRAVEIQSALLPSALSLRAGDVVLLKGARKDMRSKFLRAIAHQSHDLADVHIHAECDATLSSRILADLSLYLSRPSLLRLSLRENLAVLAHELSLEEEKLRVLQLPLLTAEEKEMGPEPLEEHEVSLSTQTRYSVLRAFLSEKPLVLIDQFFGFLEIEEQIEFLQSFRKQFPQRMLILNFHDPRLEAHATKTISLVEEVRR